MVPDATGEGDLVRDGGGAATSRRHQEQVPDSRWGSTRHGTPAEALAAPEEGLKKWFDEQSINLD